VTTEQRLLAEKGRDFPSRSKSNQRCNFLMPKRNQTGFWCK